MLDLWFERRFKKTCRGFAELTRFADDYVATFQNQTDAERFRQEMEEILDDWIRGVLGLGEGRVWHYVAAHVSIDYRAELRLEDRKAVGTVRLERVGTKSVTVRTELRAPDGRLAAEAKMVIVSRDPASGASQPLSDSERAAFQAAA